MVDIGKEKALLKSLSNSSNSITNLQSLKVYLSSANRTTMKQFLNENCTDILLNVS